MKENEIIKEKNNEVLEKKSHLFIFLVIGLIAGSLFGLVFVFKSNGIKSQLDNLLTSGVQEVIFFERDNDYKSEYVKEVLDNDLKEQGIIYTTINITNATEKEIQYIKEKLHLVGEDFSVYLMVVNGNDNVTSISTNEVDKDTIMLYFARKLLLNDNDSVLNKHYYDIGVEGLKEGNLGKAKENLEKVHNYKDEEELLKDKRFYLVDNEYEYKNYQGDNIHLEGRNITISFKYYGGSDYGDDWIFVSYWNCIAPYGCLYSNISTSSFDAKMLSEDRIETRKFQSDDNIPYDNYLKIEIISKDKIKIGIEGNYYTLTKIN